MFAELSTCFKDDSLKNKSNQRLTVVIPTLNEIVYLPGLLDALEKQTRLADEIIIADAGSTDGTVELAKAHGARVVSGGLPAAGRNAGAHAAKGDAFLFLDADVVPQPDFIVNILKEFEQNEFDVATCFISEFDENPLDRILCEGTNLYFKVIQPISPHAPGCCILSRRIIHERMGGFDESLALSEDIDYARRAKRCGKFGMITSVRIPVSMRRVRKEGFMGLGLKYAWCEMYALAGKPIRSTPFKYEFGAFAQPQSAASWFPINKDNFQLQWKNFEGPLQRFGNKVLKRIGK